MEKQKNNTGEENARVTEGVRAGILDRNGSQIKFSPKSQKRIEELDLLFLNYPEHYFRKEKIAGKYRKTQNAKEWDKLKEISQSILPDISEKPYNEILEIGIKGDYLGGQDEEVKLTPECTKEWDEISTLPNSEWWIFTSNDSQNETVPKMTEKYKRHFFLKTLLEVSEWENSNRLESNLVQSIAEEAKKIGEIKFKEIQTRTSTASVILLIISAVVIVRVMNEELREPKKIDFKSSDEYFVSNLKTRNLPEAIFTKPVAQISVIPQVQNQPQSIQHSPTLSANPLPSTPTPSPIPQAPMVAAMTTCARKEYFKHKWISSAGRFVPNGKNPDSNRDWMQGKKGEHF